MSVKLFFSCVFLFALLCFSLVVSVDAASVWSQTYGDTGYQGAYSLVATPDGGYAFAGSTSLGSYASESNHFWLVKTDANGNLQWNKTYGFGTAYSVILTSDGGFAFTGSSGRMWSVAFYLIKTDEFGNLQWNKTYGEGLARSLVTTSDGGYALAGTNFNNAKLVKTDTFGNLEWNQTYGTTDDYLRSLIATSDGGYALAGGRGNNSWLIKTNALGNMQWSKTYEETGQGSAIAVVSAPDGGYTITGYNHTGSEYDYWLVKTDAFGNMQWHKTYGAGNAQSLIVTSDGGYAITGNALVWTGEFPSNITTYERTSILAKTDAFGNLLWNQTYRDTDMGSEGPEAYSLVQTSDGGYTIAGSMRMIGLPGSKITWLAKTDEFGVVPEYSSWLVPALVLTATAFIIINGKKLHRTRKKQKF